MSSKKSSVSRFLGIIFPLAIIVGSFWLWVERQSVVDAINYYQYSPTQTVEQLTETSNMTDHGRYMFYVSRPQVDTSDDFNKNCQRREADSPILGCYTAGRIYIYNVTDDRLQGIKSVTAAHEMLHAAYERLDETEKNRLSRLLEAAYDKHGNGELDRRMEYYERTEPGQRINELHSILGTEVDGLGSDLEAYYAKYFTDRSELVKLHGEVESVFNELSEEADQLVSELEQLSGSINSRTAEYNAGVQALNRDVAEFNQRADRQGGFESQSDFEAARSELMNRSERLSESKRSIQADVARYKTLLANLEAINSESKSLNRSLDSSLSDVPEL